MSEIRTLPAEAKQFLTGYRAALNDLQTLANQREAMSLKLGSILTDLRHDADDMERSARSSETQRRKTKPLGGLFE